MDRLTSIVHGIRDFWTPVLSASKFDSHAVLTPTEFTAAGDYLVFKCPTWSWEGGDTARRRDYLPSDKQFLVTRNVPCCAPDQRSIGLRETDDNDGWFVTDFEGSASPSTAEPAKAIAPTSAAPATDPALAALVGNVSEASSEGVGLAPKRFSTRTYDLCIVYDKYYQTPKLLLQGYDENRKPLSPSMALHDISADHANKTVTLEQHPFLNSQVASIHPCRHSEVMKIFIDRLKSGGKTVRPDQYLIIFLKFMSAVIPNINYDQTMTLE